jgi:ATP-binding cassette, subfamily G (WHITE), member 2, SNQ2
LPNTPKKMATDAISKELGLNKPTEQHGTTANEHTQEQVAPGRTNRSSVDTVPDLEKPTEKQDGDAYENGREAVRTASRNSHGLVRTKSGVDVEQAERDFAELSKQFSAHSRRMSRSHSNAKVSIANKDVEKATSSQATTEDENWDLEETLRGAKQADYEAGIKSKYIGKARGEE